MQLNDPKVQPPTAQTAEPSGTGGKWKRVGQNAYLNSTSYVDVTYRKTWDDSIRAFHGQHPADSKYSSPAYDKRSKLYRPKTRSIIRKNEAAAAAAFFSNMDVVSISAEDESSKAQIASAEIMKYLLQYRLTKTIPWFQVVMGAMQDAQTIGVVASHNYWDYRSRPGVAVAPAPVEETGPQDEENPEQANLPAGAFTLGSDLGDTDEAPEAEEPPPVVYCDKPCVDLIPIENLRIDPAANWMDPINSSPFVIHLMPIHFQEVKRRMKIGEWRKFDDARIMAANSGIGDSTRSARNRGQGDAADADNAAVDEYQIIWIHRHIHRDENGEDIEFYMLGTLEMLTDPRPLKESVLINERPYTLGCAIIETHKVFSSGVPQLGKGLQDEANEVANQRIDNVKFALNKKWFAKRGKEVDIGGLVRNVPGGVVMMDDPVNDVREISWPDVTGSAYEEQNRINLDMDELLGNFNPAALIMGGKGDAPARNMAMLGQATSTLAEYLIRTVVETWIQPTLRQVVKLEQHYETDQVVLALAGKKAQLFQKYGVDQVTDDLLNQSLTLTVNVGMGATDPGQKLQKFLTATGAYAKIIKDPAPGMNVQEVGKEIYSHLGYKDGSRFFTVDDPQVSQLQQALKGAQSQIMELEQKLKDKQNAMVVGLQKTRETNQTKENVAKVQEHAANLRALATHVTALTHAHNEREHGLTMAENEPAKKSNGK